MLTDERCKELMIQVGMPNSQSLMVALKQCAMESAKLARFDALGEAGSECLKNANRGDSVGARDCFEIREAISQLSR